MNDGEYRCDTPVILENDPAGVITVNIRYLKCPPLFDTKYYGDNFLTMHLFYARRWIFNREPYHPLAKDDLRTVSICILETFEPLTNYSGSAIYNPGDEGYVLPTPSVGFRTAAKKALKALVPNLTTEKGLSLEYLRLNWQGNLFLTTRNKERLFRSLWSYLRGGLRMVEKDFPFLLETLGVIHGPSKEFLQREYGAIKYDAQVFDDHIGKNF